MSSGVVSSSIQVIFIESWHWSECLLSTLNNNKKFTKYNKLMRIYFYGKAVKPCNQHGCYTILYVTNFFNLFALFKLKKIAQTHIKCGKIISQCFGLTCSRNVQKQLIFFNLAHNPLYQNDTIFKFESPEVYNLSQMITNVQKIK